MKPLSRRALLRGAGGIAVALPFLEAMEAKAQAALPKRYVQVFSSSGVNPATWYPTGTETSFTLNTSMQPLAPYRSKLLIFENVHNRVANTGAGNAHARGVGCLFTAQQLDSTPVFGEAGYAMGISADQVIANQIGAATRFKSLELGVQVDNNTNVGRISYTGPKTPIAPQNSPKAAFDRIFAGTGGGGGDVTAAEALRARRQSVLDAVKAEFTALNGKVGTEDKRRLDAHLTSIREMEREILDIVPTSGCTPPADPGVSDPALTAGFMQGANFPKVLALQTKILVHALKCDLTRVASLMWSRGVSTTVFSWLGHTRGHHAISHLILDEEKARQEMTAITTWYAEQFAELLRQLSTTPDAGGGYLLDRTLVLWANEFSDGDYHSRKNIPFVMAGSAGGYFRTGRFLKYTTASHGDLLTSCLNAMGVAAASFGMPEYSTGPLANLR